MNIDNGVTWEDQIEQLESEASATSTVIASRPPAQEGILWSVSESIIATAKKETALLKINGVTDLVGYEAVKKAKWKFTKFRTGVEAVKKKMNEDAQRQIKKNSADAKLLLDLIEPEEERLQGLLRDIDVAIANAKQQAEDELYDLRRSKLVEAAGAYTHFVVLSESAMRHMTETEFDSELVLLRDRAENQAVIDEAAEKARYEQEQENKRVAEANKKAKEENDRLAAQLKAQQEAIAAAEKKLADATWTIRLGRMNAAGVSRKESHIRTLTDEEFETELSTAIQEWETAKQRASESRGMGGGWVPPPRELPPCGNVVAVPPIEENPFIAEFAAAVPVVVNAYDKGYVDGMRHAFSLWGGCFEQADLSGAIIARKETRGYDP